MTTTTTGSRYQIRRPAPAHAPGDTGELLTGIDADSPSEAIRYARMAVPTLDAPPSPAITGPIVVVDMARQGPTQHSHAVVAVDGLTSEHLWRDEYAALQSADAR